MSPILTYNRNVKLRWLGLILGVFFWLGCGRTGQTPEEVKQGVMDYLAARSDLDLGAIQVDVTSVQFRQNEADATVAFRPKGGAAGSGMEMRYTLEKKGGRWVVKGKGQAPAGASPHGAQAEGGRPPAPTMPPDHPPMGQAKPAEKAPAREMPPDHPPLGPVKPAGPAK